MAEMFQEINQLNVDLSCDGQCEGCEKYFICTLPQRDNLLTQPMMVKARQNLSRVKHKIMSIGGKGGVGKSVVTANLAAALAMRGRRVSVLDQDLDGPCIPRMLGVEGKEIESSPEGLIPCETLLGIQVVSMGCILLKDEVVTWFHDLRRGATEELLTQVVYGERDYLIIDVPAGTSSDTVNAIQLIPDMDGGIAVTVPSEVSQSIAYKAAMLLKKAKVPVFGIFENMGSFLCPGCGEKIDLIQAGGGKKLAEKTGIPFLGTIPLDCRISECADEGIPIVYKYPDSEPARIFREAAERLERQVWKGEG